MAKDNRLLGEFNLEGIPRPRTLPKIGHIQHQRQQHLAGLAKDLGTGKEQRVKIEQSAGTGRDEIELLTRHEEQKEDGRPS